MDYDLYLNHSFYLLNANNEYYLIYRGYGIFREYQEDVWYRYKFLRMGLLILVGILVNNLNCVHTLTRISIL